MSDILLAGNAPEILSELDQRIIRS